MYGFIQSPNAFISEKQMAVLVDKHVDDYDWSSVILLLSDATCYRTGMDYIAERYCKRLITRGCFVRIMSAIEMFRTIGEKDWQEQFGRNYDMIISVGRVDLDVVAKGTLPRKDNGAVTVFDSFISAFCGISYNESQKDVMLSQAVEQMRKNTLDKPPFVFVLTGMQKRNGQENCKGIFIGEAKETLEAAAALGNERVYPDLMLM